LPRTLTNRLTLAALVWVISIPSAAATGQQRPPVMATVTANAPIYIEPKVLSIPLRTAAVGTRLEVLTEQGDWVQVRFGDPALGPRVGWVQANLLRIERPELQPMDLSVAPPVTTAPSRPAERTRPATNVEDEAEADEEPRDPYDFDRGWVDVNFGIAFASEDAYTTRVETTLFRETAIFQADYRWPLGAAFDFGGGVMLTKNFGVGVSFSGTAHMDVATVSATVPHPFRFNLPASATADTEEQLMKVESAAHIHAMFAAMPSPRVRTRVFGGPTFFRVQQDTIDDVIYLQTAPPLGSNAIRIISAPFSEAESDGWGFHVGGDVSVFFNRVVGVGGLVRYSRGTVDLIDLVGAVVEVETGGIQAAGGLRLKF
jgi:hypothetical protein